MIAVVALAIRLGYTLTLRNHPIHADGVYYYFAALALHGGHAFVNPFTGKDAAFHPPLWTLVLTAPSVLGRDSRLAAQVFASFIGTATVVAVGFAGRRIVSPRCGIIAALVAAVYPGLWVFERSLLSETLLFLLVAVVISASYAYASRPSRGRAALVGALCGLLALTRAEETLLVVFLLVPLVLGWHLRRVRLAQVQSLAIACIAALAVVAPWTIYNISRLHEVVVTSDGLGSAMAQGNCNDVYYGRDLGYVNFYCLRPAAASAARHGASDPFAPSSLRAEALRYARAHASRVPLVLLARQGRTWSVYKPFETAETQYQFPQSPRWPQITTLWVYWVLSAVAVAGALVLRRRRITLIPLLAPFLVVAFATAITYGEPRLRAAAEVPIVLLAATALECIWLRYRRVAAAPGTTSPAEAAPLDRVG